MMRISLLMMLVLASVLCAGNVRSHAATNSADITDPRYGAKPDDGKEDTAAIQKAVDDLSQQGVLLIPPGTFQVSMAKGIAISKDHITVIIRGTIKAMAAGVEPRACRDLFTVSGDGCRFIGQGGMFVGDGTHFSYVRRPGEKNYAAFIYMGSARDCSVSALLLRDPPGLHVQLLKATDCKITNCTFDGGVKRVNDEKRRPYSHYYGVLFWGADGLLIRGNHFKRHQGRIQYQWITSGSKYPSYQVSIIGNRFVGGWDHAIYCSGIHRSVVANNTTRDSVGTAIKLIGNNLVVTGNKIFTTGNGGISARSSSGSIIANNLLHGDGNVTIAVSRYGGAKGSYTDNVIEGNIIIGHRKTKADAYSGIRILSDSGSCSRCKIVNNIVANSGHPEIPAIWVRGKKSSDSVMISGNTIYDCAGPGIRTGNVHSSIITRNIVRCTGKAIDTGKGRNVVLRDNITGKK